MKESQAKQNLDKAILSALRAYKTESAAENVNSENMLSEAITSAYPLLCTGLAPLYFTEGEKPLRDAVTIIATDTIANVIRSCEEQRETLSASLESAGLGAL